MLRMNKINGLYILDETKGQANGIASLTAELKVPTSQIPNVKSANDVLYCEDANANLIDWANTKLSVDTQILDLQTKWNATITNVVQTDKWIIITLRNHLYTYKTKDFKTFISEQIDNQSNTQRIVMIKNSDVLYLTCSGSNYTAAYVSMDGCNTFQKTIGAYQIIERGFMIKVNGVYFGESGYSLDAITWVPYSVFMVVSAVVYANNTYFLTTNNAIYTTTDLQTYTRLLQFATLSDNFYNSILCVWKQYLYFSYMDSQSYSHSIRITDTLAIQNVSISGTTASSFAVLDGYLYAIASSSLYRTLDGSTWNYCCSIASYTVPICSMKGFKINGVYIIYWFSRYVVHVFVSSNGRAFTELFWSSSSSSSANQENLCPTAIDEDLILLRAYAKTYTYKVSTGTLEEYAYDSVYANVVLGKIATPRYLIGNLSLPMTL